MKFLNLKRITIFLTSLLLILNSTLTNAATIGAWTVSNPMAVGASILYDGSKGIVKSAVLITPNATQVAKVLRGGIAGYALTLAVEQLLGAVDWVLGPANNQIKYSALKEQNNSYVYRFLNDQQIVGANNVCDAYFSQLHYIKIENKKVAPSINNNSVVCSAIITYSCYNGTRECTDGPRAEFYTIREQKTLPLETVAQKVIENAENNNLDAQFAVLAAANNILSEAENDDAKAKPIEDELENNAKDDTCVELWEEEIESCETWRGQGPSDDLNRWFRACKERATNRLRICQRTGIPPLEPPPWSRDDIM